MVIESKFNISQEVSLRDKKYKVTVIQVNDKGIEIGLKLNPPNKVKGTYYWDQLIREEILINDIDYK